MSRVNGCRKTLEEFKEDVNKIYKNDFQVISNEYINQYTNIKIKHKCGNEFEYTPKYILKGNCKCPFCEEVRCLSINEDLFKEKIKNDFILKSSYKNLTTKVILQCKKCKKEDIYYNLLIEFDGIQHFQPIKNFGGEKEFKIQQKRDIIKNNYCNKNDIQLLRINYNQLDNINNIMIKIVQRLSKP